MTCYRFFCVFSSVFSGVLYGTYVYDKMLAKLFAAILFSISAALFGVLADKRAFEKGQIAAFKEANAILENFLENKEDTDGN